AVSRSDDGGATWSPPTNAAGNVPTGPADFHDKSWMAVDNTPGSPYRGNIYVSWTFFSANTSIRLVRSTDGGQTWSPSVSLGTGAVQGSTIATGPNGEVYVAWYESSTNVGGTRLRKSTDGGLTFSTVVTALPQNIFLQGNIVTGNHEVPPFASLAVDSG